MTMMMMKVMMMMMMMMMGHDGDAGDQDEHKDEDEAGKTIVMMHDHDCRGLLIIAERRVLWYDGGELLLVLRAVGHLTARGFFVAVSPLWI